MVPGWLKAHRPQQTVEKWVPHEMLREGFRRGRSPVKLRCGTVR
jgi:hypothetical protein